MPQVIVVIRESGRLKPDYSLVFDLPDVPRVGDYISIQRPDKRPPYGEDAVVRKIWWRLKHPETAGVTSGEPKVGSATEIFVECDPAISPYSSDSWRRQLETARDHHGTQVEEFEVDRFSVRESDLDKA
ncbi:hypothetical protein ACQKQD_07670 [Methylobacterium sp. NPDC080182]|uniref:hypothetical protein n=1 Tax=Methylobacterium sp. NPDC080182 TaxID=3390590 RepID=UPI003CFD8CB8